MAKNGLLCGFGRPTHFGNHVLSHEWTIITSLTKSFQNVIINTPKFQGPGPSRDWDEAAMLEGRAGEEQRKGEVATARAGDSEWQPVWSQCAPPQNKDVVLDDL